jgi:hypothetical protein
MREPTRLPVFLRARRSGRKVCAVAVAILAVAGSASAKIRETQEQVIARSKRNSDIVKIETAVERGKPMIYTYYRDGSFVAHVFGSGGKEIAMMSYTLKKRTSQDIAEIQKTYPTKWYATGTQDGYITWESANGLLMGRKPIGQYDHVGIIDLHKMAEMPDPKEEGLKPAREITQEQPGIPLDSELNDPLYEFSPEVFYATPLSRLPNDCFIIATKAYKELKPTAYWTRIGSYMITENGKEIGRHAVCFSQPTPTANVYMYDENGALDTTTQSHDLTEIINAVNEVYRSKKIPDRLLFSKWIGGE